MEILPQLLVNALIAGSIYAIASAGLSLTYGILGILNFAHGHMMMAGAYAFYWLRVDLETSVFTASVGTVAIMWLLSSISFRLFVQPFSRYSTLLPFVTTLALSNILEAAVAMLFGVNVKSIPIETYSSSFEYADVFITPIQILIIVSTLLLLLTLAFVIHYTPLGRRMRAVSEHDPAAQGLGISGGRLVRTVFVVSGIFAAYAGVMVGYETNLQPTMGNLYTIKAIAAMILGGLGNIWGTIIGAYVLSLVENLAIGLDFWGYSLPAGYKDAFSFLIILLVLLFRPQGIFGSASRRA